MYDAAAIVVDRPDAVGSHSVRTAITYGFRFGQVDDPGVVRDGGDLAGLVRDARLARQAGRNTVPELLAVQNVQHLARQLRTERALLGDEPQQSDEPVAP